MGPAVCALNKEGNSPLHIALLNGPVGGCRGTVEELLTVLPEAQVCKGSPFCSIQDPWDPIPSGPSGGNRRPLGVTNGG